MEKKLVIILFSLLILATAVFTLIAAADSYLYDMDPENGVDILEGLEAALLFVLGFLAVVYEADLCYTVWYFLFKPKTVPRAVLTLLANAALFIPLLFLLLEARFPDFRPPECTYPILWLSYLILRAGCAVLSLLPPRRIDKRKKEIAS
jgi:hypothetical protein